MVLVRGINCGFVTEAPTADPAASAAPCDDTAVIMDAVAPETAVRITEIGWWCDNATEEANFEVGIYDDVGGFPGNLLAGASLTNAKGTGAGWKTAAVDIAITEGTAYWIGFQLDNTTTPTNMNYGAELGAWYSQDFGEATFPDPWVFARGANIIIGVYAVWDVAPIGTNMQANISDVLKDVSEIKINISDVLKDVTEAKINIGGVLKDIF